MYHFFLITVYLQKDELHKKCTHLLVQLREFLNFRFVGHFACVFDIIDHQYTV